MPLSLWTSSWISVSASLIVSVALALGSMVKLTEAGRPVIVNSAWVLSPALLVVSMSAVAVIWLMPELAV